MLLNSTLRYSNTDFYDYPDNFPLPYEDEESNNRTYYDDYLFNNNNNTQTLNVTNSDLLSIFSFSSPFSYIFFILIVYLILTIILLSFSLYKQRQNEIENFYFGDTEEEIQQAKRYLLWKQLLIGKIRKGDMEPLLIETDSDGQDSSQSPTVTFPLQIV